MTLNPIYDRQRVRDLWYYHTGVSPPPYVGANHRSLDTLDTLADIITGSRTGGSFGRAWDKHYTGLSRYDTQVGARITAHERLLGVGVEVEFPNYYFWGIHEEA